jgi:tetratricopeptide (TPR) repeat protein
MPPTITVMPIIGTGNDPQVDAMAAGVTDRIIDGLAKIDNIRVVLRSAAAASADAASARGAQADFVVNGELHKGEHSWTLQARMIKTATREVQPVASLSIDINDPDLQLKQSRLAAGIGHPLALRLNALIESGAAPDATNGGSPPGSAKVVIEQATASINQTTRERFAAAQTMLEKALAADPDNVDLQVALAALQLRGIMMVWYSPAESAAAESNAKSVLERALRAKPNFIPALEAYCRFLTATNSFLESLPACARVLSFDPWNGLALYHIGLAQINLGRFEDALANFKQADRFDTPQVSRWTWLLGAGWANALMGNNEEAVPWLQRSIAITPASGRTHMLLAAAYQQLGRSDEAKAAMEKGLELRPGSTASNYAPPTQNASPVYLAASERIIRATIEAGLPDR